MRRTRTSPDGELPSPAPFLKWAGGKTQLLPELLARVPQRFSTYHEPFVGSGALYFALAARGRVRRARLSDGNPELVNAFVVVRDAVEELIEALREHVNEADHFYRVRALDPASLAPVARAARLVFLNKTCFNGLYRESSKGRFNVPFGRHANPRICNAPGLRAASRALATTEIACEPFEVAVLRARRGDLVYLDPPYVPSSRTSSFTAYKAGGFGPADQQILARAVLDLGARGVSALVSNSDTPLARALYAGCLVERVQAARAINSKADRRGKVWELLIRPPVARATSAGRRDGGTLPLPPAAGVR